jgi:DNA invertase Pin-like site-specific DNA recombinase
MRTAYSLVRFSSAKQAKGDSWRRQTEWSDAWASKHGYRLDATLRQAKAVSAFRGKNRSKGALADFLRMVEEGQVAKGSVLLVESLDRSPARNHAWHWLRFSTLSTRVLRS